MRILKHDCVYLNVVMGLSMIIGPIIAHSESSGHIPEVRFFPLSLRQILICLPISEGVMEKWLSIF
jgi:hypothetical protein